MPHVDRSHTGQRRFTDRDLHWLDFVGKLRLTGMPVADMVRYAELVRQGEHTFAERRALLERTRRDVPARIAELQGTVADLGGEAVAPSAAGRAGRGPARYSSARSSAFFAVNSSSVTRPARCSSPR
ncbi:hypothetical protein GCM10020367_20180 [Streptomyces sannanensis]|uniref:HTH merR-type domain-containing protein n=1 Tax=Streptomyces sannanensis TaxID=285536 RepID=A0ABP6S984_9ACTN